jgi:hypothetical protein
MLRTTHKYAEGTERKRNEFSGTGEYCKVQNTFIDDFMNRIRDDREFQEHYRIFYEGFIQL